MSELKVIKSYVTTFDDYHNDMLLVSHTKENYASAKQIECYLKSEADKVIEEKDEIIDELKEHIDELQKATDSAWSKVNAMYDELRHQKYKRCLAMARWCHNQREIYERDSYNWELEAAAVNSLRNKANIMRKWHERWLELAEKFKPNN